MKKILIGLLAFSAFPAFAAGETQLGSCESNTKEVVYKNVDSNKVVVIHSGVLCKSLNEQCQIENKKYHGNPSVVLYVDQLQTLKQQETAVFDGVEYKCN